jgi:hypothetical protein
MLTKIIPQIYKMMEYKKPLRIRKNAAEMVVSMAYNYPEDFFLRELLGLVQILSTD